MSFFYILILQLIDTKKLADTKACITFQASMLDKIKKII